MTIDDPTLAVLSKIAEIRNPEFSRACLIAYVRLRTSDIGINMRPIDLVTLLCIDDSDMLRDWLIDSWSMVGTWEIEGELGDPMADEDTSVVRLGLHP